MSFCGFFSELTYFHTYLGLPQATRAAFMAFSVAIKSSYKACVGWLGSPRESEETSGINPYTHPLQCL